MKKIVVEFLRRGVVACGFGPIVLAVVYLVLQKQFNVQTLTVNEVCTGIISLTVLGFVVGGMNAIYQIERLPLMIAILIHGSVLYLSYLATYLLNDWLEWGTGPIVGFSIIFVLGYLVIWAVIYSIIKKNTEKINQMLRQKQQSEEN